MRGVGQVDGRRGPDDGSREPVNVPHATFRSYYGRAVLKPPVWEWRIPAYFFTGGLSAGSALLAAGADLTGRPALRRAGRLGSLASLLASMYLLVADLGRPDWPPRPWPPAWLPTPQPCSPRPPCPPGTRSAGNCRSCSPGRRRLAAAASA